MEIGKPQINIPRVNEEPKIEQASSDLQAHSPGFANEDLIETAPDHDLQYDFRTSAESFGQPEVPQPTLHGPHFELGQELREALTPDNGLVDELGDDALGVLPGDPDVPLPDSPSIKAELRNVDRIVDNLKNQIQDSLEATIHPFEDWFD